MTRWPVGRGPTPRHDGACVHHWQRLRESAAFVCRFCRTQQEACPHDWLWAIRHRQWVCRFCAAVRFQD